MVGGGARIDGRAIRDSLFRAAVRRGAQQPPGNAVLRAGASRVTGVTIGADKIDADTVVVAAGAWTAQVTLEETVTDPDSGRVANATLSDYLVAVNADAPDIDVAFVGGPDPGNPIGAKGIGEVGFVGVPAAIANCVYHATGRRIRSLPITISQLL
jgi:hypothetical protein